MRASAGPWPGAVSSTSESGPTKTERCACTAPFGVGKEGLAALPGASPTILLVARR
jgi:hypothetical protein